MAFRLAYLCVLCASQAELDAVQGRLADATGEIEQLRRQQQDEHDNFEAGLHRWESMCIADQSLANVSTGKADQNCK